MAPPVALVTGAGGGIGLALTQDLVSRGWSVVMADVKEPQEKPDHTLFVSTDITSWDQQASLFKQAYEWKGRLDFCALNAGIDDRDDIFNSIPDVTAGPPKQPNMATIHVNLIGPYYGIKLAAYYLSLDSTAAGKPRTGGKIVVTASAAGIYPLPSVPVYAASKHGLVGLVRSIASAAGAANISVNAVCPTMVATGFPPPALKEAFPPDNFTPLSTILKCFNELADLDNVSNDGWVDQGVRGATVECNMQDLIPHQAPTRPVQTQYMDKKGLEVWANVFKERYVKFASEDWKKSQ